MNPLRISTFTQALLASFVLLALAAAPAAHATIRKAGGWLFGPAPVWTDGATTPIFHPMGDALPSAGLINVRASIELSEKTGTCQIRPALRYSDNGVTWDAPNPILTTYTATNTVVTGTTYVDITATGAGFAPKPWVQFGVQAINSSGTGVNLCRATLLVEPKEK